MRDTERETETQAEGEAGSMHREPDVGFDPGSPGSRPGPKAGAKPLRHPGIPAHLLIGLFLYCQVQEIREIRDPWVAQRFGACLWPRA